MNKILLTTITFSLTCCLSLLILLPLSQAAAVLNTNLGYSDLLNQAGSQATYNTSQQSQEGFINSQIAKIIVTVMGLVGIAFFVLVIYSGIQWMTAGGNEEKIGEARTRLIQAAIGLGIALCAVFIVNFIYQYLENKYLTGSQNIAPPPNYQNIPCTVNAQCADRQKSSTANPGSQTCSNGHCVECTANGDCKTNNTCNTTYGVCVPASK